MKRSSDYTKKMQNRNLHYCLLPTGHRKARNAMSSFNSKTRPWLTCTGIEEKIAPESFSCLGHYLLTLT